MPRQQLSLTWTALLSLYFFLASFFSIAAPQLLAWVSNELAQRDGDAALGVLLRHQDGRARHHRPGACCPSNLPPLLRQAPSVHTRPCCTLSRPAARP